MNLRDNMTEGTSIYSSQKRKLESEEPLKKSRSISSVESFTGNHQEKPVSSKSRGICLPAAIADGLARHHAHEQSIYKQKLKKLKKIMKELVLENAALCDTVASVQEDVAIAMEERQYLLRKLIQIQLNTEQQLHLGSKLFAKCLFFNGFHIHLVATHQCPDSANFCRLSWFDLIKTSGSAASWFDDVEEEIDRQTSRRLWCEERSPLNIGTNKALLLKKKSLENTIGQKLGSNIRDKSQLKKVTKIKKKCPPIPLDSSGRPIFPLNLGRLTIHSLGEIVGDKKTYHTEKMIYPVGFCSSRMYASLRNPHQETLYTCTIKDGGTSPRFDIVCDEDEVTFTGSTPSDCHSQILNKINMILGIDLLPTSPETAVAEDRSLRFFGLSHPSVQNMIQACPGARKCSKYKWIQYEVCKSEAEAEGVSEPEREASICHETLLRNIRFASNHM